MAKHYRDPLEHWPEHPRGKDSMWCINHMRAGSIVLVDHPWVEETEWLMVTGKMRKGQRRVVHRLSMGGTLALPWETPVLQKRIPEPRENYRTRDTRVYEP